MKDSLDLVAVALFFEAQVEAVTLDRNDLEGVRLNSIDPPRTGTQFHRQLTCAFTQNEKTTHQSRDGQTPAEQKKKKRCGETEREKERGTERERE